MARAVRRDCRSSLCHTDCTRLGGPGVMSQTRKLDDVNACFADVLAGRVPARLVFEF